MIQIRSMIKKITAEELTEVNLADVGRLVETKDCRVLVGVLPEIQRQIRVLDRA